MEWNEQNGMDEWTNAQTNEQMNKQIATKTGSITPSESSFLRVGIVH